MSDPQLSSASRGPRIYSSWAQLCAVGLLFALIVLWVVVGTSWTAEAELTVGLTLLFAGVVVSALAAAASWPGPRGAYGFLLFAMSWLACAVISGASLAIYALDSVPGPALRVLAMFTLPLTPFFMFIGVALAADRTRKRWRAAHPPRA